jgi:MOSC domain-containing protein YiiM
MSLQETPELHLTPAELEEGLPAIREAPKDEGTLELIVRRPTVEEREILEEAQLDLELGLVGDNWSTRGRSGGRPANTKAQVTVMNVRATALVARERERWPLAGDQLYVDFDISGANLPPGTRFAVGSAVLEVTDDPHTGCKKFSSRFGLDALIFVNSAEGRALNLRGINTRVVQAGVVRIGDAVRRL